MPDRFQLDSSGHVATLAGQGERDAFAELYRRYGGAIYDFCVRLTGSEQDGADVMQEVFVRASTRISQLREPERVRAWLYAIARHECYSFTKRRSRTTPKDPYLVGTTVESKDRSAAGQVESTELVELVQAARAGLDDDDRSLLDLRFRHELTGSDLADAAGVPPDQVHKALARATERFERALTTVVMIRHGRKDCDVLDQVVSSTSEGGPLLRKRVARHVEECDVCHRRKKALINPSTMSASAMTLGARFVAPAALGAAIMSAVDTGSVAGARRSSYRWKRDGFPVARRSRKVVALAALGMGLLLATGVATGVGLSSDSTPTPVATTVVLPSTAGERSTTTSTLATSTTTASSTTSSTTIATTTTAATTTAAPSTTIVTAGVVESGDEVVASAPASTSTSIVRASPVPATTQPRTTTPPTTARPVSSVVRTTRKRPVAAAPTTTETTVATTTSTSQPPTTPAPTTLATTTTTVVTTVATTTTTTSTTSTTTVVTRPTTPTSTTTSVVCNPQFVTACVPIGATTSSTTTMVRIIFLPPTLFTIPRGVVVPLIPPTTQEPIR